METGLAESRILAERTILVHVQLPADRVRGHDPLAELRALAETAGVRVVGELTQNLKQPRGATYLGKGKVEELAAMAASLQARVVIFDNDLSPSQVQGLEEAIRCKVLDRSELILDIFANRATTRQAQLQVEIAQLQYTAPRLRAMWAHLGQVTGGAPVGVGTRGPGEQQLEIDRRLVKSRLDRLRGELQEIASRKVTVNCVAPGFIATPMTDVLNDKQKEGILGAVPAGRLRPQSTFAPLSSTARFHFCRSWRR